MNSTGNGPSGSSSKSSVSNGEQHGFIEVRALASRMPRLVTPLFYVTIGLNIVLAVLAGIFAYRGFLVSLPADATLEASWAQVFYMMLAVAFLLSALLHFIELLSLMRYRRYRYLSYVSHRPLLFAFGVSFLHVVAIVLLLIYVFQPEWVVMVALVIFSVLTLLWLIAYVQGRRLARTALDDFGSEVNE